MRKKVYLVIANGKSVITPRTRDAFANATANPDTACIRPAVQLQGEEPDARDLEIYDYDSDNDLLIDWGNAPVYAKV